MITKLGSHTCELISFIDVQKENQPQEILHDTVYTYTLHHDFYLPILHITTEYFLT